MLSFLMLFAEMALVSWQLQGHKSAFAAQHQHIFTVLDGLTLIWDSLVDPSCQQGL